MTKKILPEILKLSVAERILLVEAIWDSIPEEPKEYAFSAEHKQVLNDRLEEYKKNPTEGLSWEEVKKKIQN